MRYVVKYHMKYTRFIQNREILNMQSNLVSPTLAVTKKNVGLMNLFEKVKCKIGIDHLLLSNYGCSHCHLS